MLDGVGEQEALLIAHDGYEAIPVIVLRTADCNAQIRHVEIFGDV